MAKEDKEGLAEERTDLAEDRTILANERTFAGWVRTGMAAVGIGVGFHALFRLLEPDWVPKSIATAFILIGIFTFVTSARRACRVTANHDTHAVKTAPPMNVWLMSGLLSAASLALIAGIWLLVE